MNSQTNIYFQNLAARPEQNRRVIVLALLSKLALALFLGVIYTGIRFMG